MKKVVQLRWNDCPSPDQRLHSVAPLSSRCRVAMDRRAFSDLDALTLLQVSSDLEPTVSSHQMNTIGGFTCQTPSAIPVAFNGEMFPKSTSLRGPTRHSQRTASWVDKPRSGNRDIKPSESYWELIANVFKSERKAEMKKSDIVTNLKSRYPYFQSLPKFGCRVGDVLNRHCAFKLVKPGTWQYVGDDSKTGQDVRSKKRQRVRRRPDFLKVEWKKMRRSDEGSTKRNMQRRKTTREDTTSESEVESVKPDTSSAGQNHFSASEQTSTEHQCRPEIDIWKKILVDFNEKILKRVIAEVTEANQKCFEHLITSMKAVQPNSTRRACGEQVNATKAIQKNNQQLLQDTIDKLIAENEKCLMDLAHSTSESRISRPDTRIFIPTYEAGESALTRNDKQAIEKASPSIDAPCKSHPRVPSTPPFSDSGKSSKAPLTEQDVPPYPLPTIIKRNVKANAHVRLGKRIVPRLIVDSSADSAKNISQSDSSDVDGPRPKRDFTTVCLNAMKTISPTTSATKKIRLSVEPSNASTPSEHKGDSNAVVDEPGDHTPEADVNSGVNDVFVEFARKNKELNDIVAMIDPTLSRTICSQDQRTTLAKTKRDSIAKNMKSVPVAADASRPAGGNTYQAPNASDTLKQQPHSTKRVQQEVDKPEKDDPTRKRDLQASTSAKTSAQGAAIKREPNRTVSFQPTTSNANHPIRIISSTTHLRPPGHLANRRPQLYTAPRTNVSAYRGIDIRYIPPYRWATNITQQSSAATSNFTARGPQSYRVVYTNARPNAFSQTIGPRPQLPSSSHLPCPRNSTLNDVRCRIRGATVLRFPVRQ